MMSRGVETPFLLSPLTAAETTRVGSSSWHRWTMALAIFAPCSAISLCNVNSSFPMDQIMMDGELRKRFTITSSCANPRG